MSEEAEKYWTFNGHTEEEEKQLRPLYMGTSDAAAVEAIMFALRKTVVRNVKGNSLRREIYRSLVYNIAYELTENSDQALQVLNTLLRVDSGET